MKHYKRLLICLVFLFSAVAFAPALAFPWKEPVTWQQYAQNYQPPDQVYIFLPLLKR